MVESVSIDHEGDYVVIMGPEKGKLARIPAEKAIKVAHDILDAAEKALRGTKQFNEYV